MDKNKTQILVLDKNELETVAKALATGCWTLTDSGDIEITNCPSTSGISDSAPKLTIAQGNVQPITHVSKAGGSGSVKHAVPSQPVGLQRDSSHVTTLTELGKKLIEAAKVGDTSQVRRLLAVGAPFPLDGPIGMNPLHLASQNGHYETCERLLSAGMNKDARNKVDKTPLHLATMAGHTEIVHLLLKNGANVNACDMLRMTPLHWACDRGHISIVRFLLQYEAQTDITNKFHKTPLHLAVENNHNGVIMLLQGKILHDDQEVEEEEEGEEEQEVVEQESVDVKSSVFNLPSTSIPVVCKAEKICKEEILVEEVYESPEGCSVTDDALPRATNELPHSIMDDLEDQNISVFATLAELAQATKSSDHSLEMSNAAALELLKAQAALLPLDDSSTLVTSAVAHGQTLHLTEAGRQALKLIKPEFPLFPTSTLPKEKSQEEEKSLNEKTSESSSTVQKNQPPSPIALPPPPPPPPPQQSPFTSMLSPKSSLSSPSSSSSSSLLSVSSLPSLPSTSSSPSSSVHGVSCLPVLLPSPQPEEEEEEEQMEVAQVITLTPEQYAALTNGASGPVILQVLPSEDTPITNEASVNPAPSTSKRQKIV